MPVQYAGQVVSRDQAAALRKIVQGENLGIGNRRRSWQDEYLRVRPLQFSILYFGRGDEAIPVSRFDDAGRVLESTAGVEIAAIRRDGGIGVDVVLLARPYVPEAEARRDVLQEVCIVGADTIVA